MEKQDYVLGSQARMLLGLGPNPEQTLDEAFLYLHYLQSHLSRFNSDSELSRLNRSQSEEVEISPLLHRALSEALHTAEKSGGIIDPTIGIDLCRGGYEKSWEQAPLPINQVLQCLPAERLARPSGNWKKVELGEGTVRRPVGLEIDLGGVGKGMAADDVAEKMLGYSSWCVDLGGDLRFGGRSARTVQIPSPFGKGKEVSFEEQAVATSGVWRRIWMKGDQLWHHLLDPSSGLPVWSEFTQVTAFAPTVKEAERISKQVLLTGNRFLLENGGLLLGWDGEWSYA